MWQKVALAPRQHGTGIWQKVALAPPGDEGLAARLLSRHLNMTSAIDTFRRASAAQDVYPGEPLQFAVVSGAQLCLFDNFLHYYRMHQLVVFNTDIPSLQFCFNRSAALAGRITVHCVEPVACQPGTGCKELENNYLMSPEYIRLTWMKPTLLQLALELGAKSVLTMDIDNLQIRDFLQEIPRENGWKLKVAENPVRIHPNERYPNSGFIFATQETWECATGWVSNWPYVNDCVIDCEKNNEPGAFCHCMTDQDGLVYTGEGRCFQLLNNETFFTNRVWRPPSKKAVTVHAVAGEDKVKDLRAGGLWHPDVLTDGDCHFDGSYPGIVKATWK